MSSSKAIYRNSSGCCICRTKSSSSRFTQSKRYENTFQDCFKVSSMERSGFICNSCVLIVKRFRKNTTLLSGVKDWSHKIDSRIGPGSKPKSHRKITASAAVSAASSRNSSPLRVIPSKPVGKPVTRNTSSHNGSSLREVVLRKSCTTSRGMERKVTGVAKRKAYTARRRSNTGLDLDLQAFIDPLYFKRCLSECCGEQYQGSRGDILAALQPCTVSTSTNLQCSLSWTTLLTHPTPDPSDAPTSHLSPPAPLTPVLHDDDDNDETSRSDVSADSGNVVSQSAGAGSTAVVTPPGDGNTGGLLTPVGEEGEGGRMERAKDETARLLTEVSACLSAVGGAKAVVGWVKGGEISEESSGVESRADLGESPPLSIESASTSEDGL